MATGKPVCLARCKRPNLTGRLECHATFRSMKNRLNPGLDVHSAVADDFPAEQLFAMSDTAVLIAIQSTGRVVAVNPAAQRLLDMSRAELVGSDWRTAFGESCAARLQEVARQAAESGAAAQASAPGRAGRGSVSITLSTFCVSRATYLLVRLAAGDVPAAASGEPSPGVIDALDALATGFVLTDGELLVEFVNRAFLELLRQPDGANVERQSLLRWMSLTQADLARMRRQMALREAATVTTTVLSAGVASTPMVEVTAVAVPDATSPRWGFIVREILRH